MSTQSIRPTRQVAGVALVCRFPASVLLALCLFLWLGAGSARAADRHVPGTYATIQLAVNAAASGDTIRIAAGTYLDQHLTVGKSLIFEGVGDGADPSTSTIIDGNRKGRLFYISKSVTVTFRKLRLQNGHISSTGYLSSQYGGGIYNAGTLTIDHCTVTGNSATVKDGQSFVNGGAIGNFGALTVLSSTITGNFIDTIDLYEGAFGRGGAIYNGGTLAVIGSTLSQNYVTGGDEFSSAGGAIANSTVGKATIDKSLLSKNTASSLDKGTSSGGAIYNESNLYSAGSVQLTNSTLSENLSLVGNQTDGSGGAIGNRGILIIDACTFNNNTVSAGADAGGGGGVIDNSGTLTLTNSTFSNNSATADGGGTSAGGVLSSRGTMTVKNCTFSDNTAFTTDGSAYGGVIANGGTASVSNSKFTHNSAVIETWPQVARGGAIANGGTLELTDCTLSDNLASTSYPWGRSYGGGIDNGGNLTVNRCTVSNNSVFAGNTGATPDSEREPELAAKGYGGGISNANTLTVIDSTISANTVTSQGALGESHGGGIFSSGTMTLTNSTFFGNSISGDTASLALGGNVKNDNALTLRNTIFASGGSGGNYASQGGSLISNGHNISDDATVPFVAGSGDKASTNPKLGPLQNNGGPTFTHALLMGSPAIDAGLNSDAPLTDQRGYTRMRPADPISDIGAFEVVDTTGPVITNKPGIRLSPPDHRYVTLKVTDCVTSAYDDYDGNLLNLVKITKVYSDEPEDAPGTDDGTTLKDIVIALDGKSVQLRAECNLKGNGRIYQIQFRVADSSGNVTYKAFWVDVRSNPLKAAVNDGAAKGYTVYAP